MGCPCRETDPPFEMPRQEEREIQRDPESAEDFPRMKIYRCFDPRTFQFDCVRIK